MKNQRRAGFISLVLFFALATGASLVLSSRASAQSARAWSTAGSTGTVDEDSASIAQVKNFTVTLQPGATGSVHIRYNITPTDGLSSFCPATTSLVRVRFRNSDNTGTSAKLTFEIHSSDINAGTNNTVYSFDSNGKGLGASFTTYSDSAAPIDFNFATNIYWIEATIFRNNAAQFSDLGTIQISENAGVACP